MKWHVTPYLIFGVKLHAAEDNDGVIDGYFDTREDARNRCDKLNDGSAKFGCLGGCL